MSLLMGIDLGSTSIKALIVDKKGNTISIGTTPTVVDYPDNEHPSWAVWYPDKIWKSVCTSVRKALSGIDDPEQVKALAVTGFGMDGLPVDESGKDLYPFISWHCSRTEQISREWSEKTGAETIFNISGKQVMPIDSIYRMIWLKENHPEIMQKTYKWLLIEDFINMKLCGAFATDFSMASTTSVLDQESKTWSKDLIEKAGIDISIFPDIKASGTFLGKVNQRAEQETGLSQKTQVILGGHDYHCGALPIGAFTDKVLMDITGTWEILLQATKKPALDHKVFSNGIISESHVAKDMYNLAVYSVSGNMVEWVKDNFFDSEDLKSKNLNVWDEMISLVESAPLGSNGVFFGPYFSGAGSPIMDSQALGSFTGLSNKADKASLFRAVYEGLDYLFRDMLLAFEDATGTSPEKIIAIGGAVKNTFWMQNKADVSGKTIEIPQIDEGTALGAAMLAGIGSEIYKDIEDAYAAVKKDSITFIPDMEKHEQYKELFEIYKEIYPGQKTLNRKISQKFRN
jgi:xylulokinase